MEHNVYCFEGAEKSDLQLVLRLMTITVALQSRDNSGLWRSAWVMVVATSWELCVPFATFPADFDNRSEGRMLDLLNDHVPRLTTAAIFLTTMGEKVTHLTATFLRNRSCSPNCGYKSRTPCTLPPFHPGKIQSPNQHNVELCAAKSV